MVDCSLCDSSVSVSAQELRHTQAVVQPVEVAVKISPLGASELAVLYWLVADFAVREGSCMGRLDELSMSFLSFVCNHQWKEMTR